MNNSLKNEHISQSNYLLITKNINNFENCCIQQRQFENYNTMSTNDIIYCDKRKEEKNQKPSKKNNFQQMIFTYLVGLEHLLEIHDFFWQEMSEAGVTNTWKIKITSETLQIV